MARQVTGTAGSFLDVDIGTGLVNYPITLACRFKLTSATIAAGGSVVATYGEWYPEPNADYIQLTPTAISAVVAKQGNVFSGVFATTLAADQWYLAVCVMDGVGNIANYSHRIYLDESTQTGIQSTPVAYVGATHPTRHITVGGLLLAAGSLYTTGGFNGHVADVAIWDTALTATDVDALAEGTPGTVKPANLKGWWKLPADGDLTTSVGTYGPMVVYGTCPATADPSVGPVFYNVPIYTPPKLYAATDPDAPVRDKLLLWYPGTPPFTDAWGQGYGNQVADTGEWTKYSGFTGQDNSLRIVKTFTGNQTVSVSATPIGASYSGLTWSCWVRVYSWENLSGTYYYGLVYLFSTNSLGYGIHAGFTTDILSTPYYTPRRFFARQLHLDGPVVFQNYTVPTDEWVHVSIIVKFAYAAQPGYSKLFVNGVPVELGTNTIDRDAYSPDVPTHAFGAGNYGQSSAGDFTAKDFRGYKGPITDSEAFDIYQHSLEFHQATSGLVRSDIRPVRILEKLDYIPGETGVYDLAGPATGLRAIRRLTGSLGTYLLSTPATMLKFGRIFPAAAGTYSTTGQATALHLIRLLQSNPGGFILSGKAATTTLARNLLADYGIYNLEGMEADLLFRVIHEGSGRTLYIMREDRTLRIIPDPDRWDK